MQGHTNVWALGDCGAVYSDGEMVPTTAQFAVREAQCLAQNINAVRMGTATTAFQYVPRGSMASLGNYTGVAEVLGSRWSGLLAWLLWRSFYIAMLPGFSTRLRVGLNWLFDYFLPRSIVQLDTSERRGVRYVHLARGDVLFAPGQVVDGFYTVISGALESRIPDALGQGVDYVRIYDKGDHWGERTAPGNLTRGWLTALEDTVLMLLQAPDFVAMKDHLPALGEYFAHIPESYYRIPGEKPIR